MKRLIEGIGKNSPEEYDKIFKERQEKGVDYFDLKRWYKLIRYFKGGRLIDLGTLDSLVPILAKIRFPNSECWGIDTVELSIQRMALNNPNINYQKRDVYNTGFDSEYFDYAVAGELIEHLEYPEKFFSETFRILKKGGMLALSTPKEEHHGEVDGERHLWSFTKEDIRRFLLPYGKVTIGTIGSQFFPRYVYHHDIILAYCVKNT